jgi:hypothetical protein
MIRNLLLLSISFWLAAGCCEEDDETCEESSTSYWDDDSDNSDYWDENDSSDDNDYWDEGEPYSEGDSWSDADDSTYNYDATYSSQWGTDPGDEDYWRQEGQKWFSDYQSGSKFSSDASECTSHSECKDSPHGTLCHVDLGFCAQCVTSEQCGESGVCYGGSCFE